MSENREYTWECYIGDVSPKRLIQETRSLGAAEASVQEYVESWREDRIQELLDHPSLEDEMQTPEEFKAAVEKCWVIERADAIKDCVSLLEKTYEEMIKEASDE
jgi:hypothetical protein